MSQEQNPSDKKHKTNEERMIELLDTIALMGRLQHDKLDKILKIANFFFFIAIIILILFAISILA